MMHILISPISFQVLESYERAYSNMVRVQQLSELEEVCSDIITMRSLIFWCFALVKSDVGKYLFCQVIDYCTLPIGDPVAEGRRALIRNMWTQRIQGAKSNVEVDRISLQKVHIA